MKRVVEAGNTLLVDGPVSVSLLSGKVDVLGAPLGIEERLVVREGKRLPLWVIEQASLDLMLGEGASVNEVAGGTVPVSWEDATKQFLALEKPVTVLVLGGVDSGKTSFCTFLVNAAVLSKLKTAVIDADLGQSDVGPPLTVGFSFVSEPVKDLFDLDAQEAVFVGSTSPSTAIKKVVESVVQLKDMSIVLGAEFLVINTDGWVEGEEAVAYKELLTKTVAPSAVMGIQRAGELVPILDGLSGVKVFGVDSPQVIYPRSREKRKVLRELSYKKYLKRAKMLSLSFNWLKVNDSLFGAGGLLPHKRLDALMNLLKVRPLYSKETVAEILVVLRKNNAVSEAQIEAAENYFGKRVKVIVDGEEQGLLVGLKDEENKFLGIGILQGVDYKHRHLKIYTPVSEKVHALCFGQIKLNKNCKEIGLSTVCSSGLQ